MCKKKVVKCKVNENPLSGHTKEIARITGSRAGEFSINVYTMRKFPSWMRKTFSNMIKTNDQNWSKKASSFSRGVENSRTCFLK